MLHLWHSQLAKTNLQMKEMLACTSVLQRADLKRLSKVITVDVSLQVAPMQKLMAVLGQKGEKRPPRG